MAGLREQNPNPDSRAFLTSFYDHFSMIIFPQTTEGALGVRKMP